MSDLPAIARCLRGHLVRLSHEAKTAHLGSALSCVDILVAAYWDALRIDPARPQEEHRDRLVFSKGHAATALYAALWQRGFLDDALMATYAQAGGALPEHPSPGCAPGVEVMAGSLGHGLSMGVGMALGARIRGLASRVYVVMSDGECNEGVVWEAALMAPAQRLETLVAIVDFNRWQATGRSAEIMALAPLREKWAAFGWSAYDVDGHDVHALADLLRKVPDGSGKPVAIVAHTVKGKGVSFMEDDNNWHYRIPNAEELARALQELE